MQFCRLSWERAHAELLSASPHRCLARRPLSWTGRPPQSAFGYGSINFVEGKAFGFNGFSLERNFEFSERFYPDESVFRPVRPDCLQPFYACLAGNQRTDEEQADRAVDILRTSLACFAFGCWACFAFSFVKSISIMDTCGAQTWNTLSFPKEL